MNVTKEVESLVKRAATTQSADEALKFSQAACNAANAMACLANIKKTSE